MPETMKTAAQQRTNEARRAGKNAKDNIKASSGSVSERAKDRHDTGMDDGTGVSTQGEETKAMDSSSEARDEHVRQLKYRTPGAKVQRRIPPSPSNFDLAAGHQSHQSSSLFLGDTNKVTDETFDWLREQQYHPVEDMNTDTNHVSSLSNVRKEVKHRMAPTQQVRK